MIKWKKNDDCYNGQILFSNIFFKDSKLKSGLLQPIQLGCEILEKGLRVVQSTLETTKEIITRENPWGGQAVQRTRQGKLRHNYVIKYEYHGDTIMNIAGTQM